MGANYRVTEKCLVLLWYLLLFQQNNFLIHGHQIDIECIPLENCPIAMKLVSTKKYAPETIKFLRKSHCGRSKKSEPLVWCPNLNSCLTPDNENGTCVDLNQCPGLLRRSASTADLSTYRCNNYLDNAFYVCCSNQEPHQKMWNRLYKEDSHSQNLQDLSRDYAPSGEMQSDQPRYPINPHPDHNPHKKYPHGHGSIRNRFNENYLDKDSDQLWNEERDLQPWNFPDSEKNNDHSHDLRPEVNRHNHHETNGRTTSGRNDRGYWRPKTSLDKSSTSYEATTTSNMEHIWSAVSSAASSKFASPTSSWRPKTSFDKSSTRYEATTSSNMEHIWSAVNSAGTSKFASSTSSWRPKTSFDKSSTIYEAITASNMEHIWSVVSSAATSEFASSTSSWRPKTSFDESSTRYEATTSSNIEHIWSAVSSAATSKFASPTSSWRPKTSLDKSSTSYEATTTSNMEHIWSAVSSAATSKFAKSYPSSTSGSASEDASSTPTYEGGDIGPTSRTVRTDLYESVAFENISTICGRQTNYKDKIIGGREVDLGEFPWMALLEYSTSSNGRKFGCGGTLINKRYVLTAAHCVDQRVLQARNLRLHRVLLGEYDTRNVSDCIYSPYGSKCSDPPIYFGISSVLAHERFDNVNAVDDVALIRLDSDVAFTDYIRPICLPDADFSMKVNESFTVAGWGKTSPTDGGSPVLLKTRLPLVRNDACERYGNTDLSGGQMCAGVGGGVDTCTGDSGGPLMVDRVRNFEMVAYVVGIVSYGFAAAGCGNAPSVNTYLPPYVDWIRRNVR